MNIELKRIHSSCYSIAVNGVTQHFVTQLQDRTLVYTPEYLPCGYTELSMPKQRYSLAASVDEFLRDYQEMTKTA